MGSIPGLRRSPGIGNGNLLQYSCLENSMDRGAWWVHGVAKSQTWLGTHRAPSVCSFLLWFSVLWTLLLGSLDSVSSQLRVWWVLPWFILSVRWTYTGGNGTADFFFFNLLCLGDCCLPLPDIQNPENHYLMFVVWLKQFFKGGMVNKVSVILSWLAVEILFSYIFSVFISFKYFLHLKFILLWGHGFALIYFFRGLPNTIYLFNIWFDLSSLSCVEFLYVAGSVSELLFCCVYVYRVLGIVCISNGVISDSANSFIELI